MKVQELIPIVSDIIVTIEGVKYRKKIPITERRGFEKEYKEIPCSTIEVTCHTQGDIWTCNIASCKEPYFIMGSAFWEECFGKRQTNRIKKLCDKAIKDYLEKEEII